MCMFCLILWRTIMLYNVYRYNYTKLYDANHFEYSYP